MRALLISQEPPRWGYHWFLAVLSPGMVGFGTMCLQDLLRVSCWGHVPTSPDPLVTPAGSLESFSHTSQLTGQL